MLNNKNTTSSPLDEELERYKLENGGTFVKTYTGDASGYSKVSLSPDEKVIWEGIGEVPKELGNNKQSVGTKLFAIPWLLFSVIWTLGAFAAGGAFMGLFGVPFIIIGVTILFSKTPKPKYIITDKRVVSKVNNKEYFTFLDSIASANVVLTDGLKGDIFYQADGKGNYNMLYTGGVIKGIDNANQVYALFERAVFTAQEASRKMNGEK